MVYVSRATRIARVLKALPHHLWKTYPEQMAFYSTFGVVSVGLFGYRIKQYLEGRDEKPYYRGYYDIVRPSDPIALQWRTPTDYPAPYLTNRENVNWETVDRDYGYKSKI
uniref:NADH dehydrogenase [ubiquinone] 1 alpha subcomplex subunit 4 n=1 Tax=Rhabditophanes sp. KR3021 TaxID=114890 RepID=A0AC35TP41_9BILA